MNLFSKFFDWFKSVLGSKKANDIAKKIKEAMDAALPIVKLIAEITPVRTDDVIIALFEKYFVPNVNAFLLLPIDQRGPALLEVATTIVSTKLPDTTPSIVRAGVQLAVVQLKTVAEEDKSK